MSASEPSLGGVFDRMAASYDEQRVPDAAWWETFDVSVEEGLGAATRVLDVGCGTGALVEAMVQRLGVRAWGVDPSPEMLVRARAREVRGAGWKQAAASSLPFRDAWFDAAVMRLVAHTLGRSRPAAFAEIARVLEPAAPLLVWTFGREHFEQFFLNPYLPSLAAVDLARFPDPDELARELAAAGFATVRTRALAQHGTIGRAAAAARLRGGYISTIHLLDPAEVASAVERLEAEDAAGARPLERRLQWRLVIATR